MDADDLGALYGMALKQQEAATDAINELAKEGVNRENGKNRALALADKRQGSATQYLPVLSCPFRKKT